MARALSGTRDVDQQVLQFVFWFVYTGDQPIGREEGMLTNGKGPAEALRPGPTTTTCLLTYHCLLVTTDETTETGETRESSDTCETSENSENIVSDQTGRGTEVWAYLPLLPSCIFL